MPRLLVLSDLHLEHRPSWSLPEAFPSFDVAVFAGDVDGSPERAVRRLAAEPGLAGRPVVFVSGNHEFYDGRMDERLAAGRAACAGTLVHLLDRDAVPLAGVRFVGATLWTDYRLFGDPAAAMTACRRGMPDHRLIGVGPPRRGRRFQPEDAERRHVEDRAFIAAELARPFAGPSVVVTHHAPHPGSVAPRYAHDALTPAFVSDLTGVILTGRPVLWVHGHVHGSYDYRVGDTRVLCNPKGHGPRAPGTPPENPAFDSGLVVEVAAAGPVRDGPRRDGPTGAECPFPATFRLERWTVLRVVATRDLHVLGYRVEGGRGRCSSPMRSFDVATRTATTSTGSRYVLVGPPSPEGFADPLVLAWLAGHRLAPAEVEVIDGAAT